MGNQKEKKDTDTVVHKLFITKDDEMKASKKCSDVKSLKQKNQPHTVDGDIVLCLWTRQSLKRADLGTKLWQQGNRLEKDQKMSKSSIRVSGHLI